MADGGDGVAREDARHMWNLCGGKLATIIYNDLMSWRGTGSGLAHAVFHDGHQGAISSIPGNTGTRSTMQPRSTGTPSTPGGGGPPPRGGASASGGGASSSGGGGSSSGGGGCAPGTGGLPPEYGESPPAGGESSPVGGESPPVGGGSASGEGGSRHAGGVKTEGAGGSSRAKRKNKTSAFEANRRQHLEDLQKRRQARNALMAVIDSTQAMEKARKAKALQTASVEHEEAEIKIGKSQGGAVQDKPGGSGSPHGGRRKAFTTRSGYGSRFSPPVCVK